MPSTLMLQVVVTVPGMATRTVWLDEAFSAVTARGTLAQIREALANDNGPPLHYPWRLGLTKSVTLGNGAETQDLTWQTSPVANVLFPAPTCNGSNLYDTTWSSRCCSRAS